MKSYLKTLGLIALMLMPVTSSGQMRSSERADFSQGVPSGYHLMTLPLPQQALMCDLAGVGRVLESTASQVDLQLQQLWHGFSATNRVTIRYNMGRLDGGPETNSVVLFFATTNLWWALNGTTNFPPSHRLYSFAIATNRPLMYDCTVTNWTVINDSASLITVGQGNSNLCSFAQNLLNAAHVNHDSSIFYDLIIAGATNNASEIRGSARSYVFLCEAYIPRAVVDRVYQKESE